MSILKKYSNKQLGKFTSVPSSKLLKTDTKDSLYFAKYMHKLSKVDTSVVRDSTHYKNTIAKWDAALIGTDITNFNEIGTKLKMNINVHSPFKSTIIIGGNDERKSYTRVHLLKIGGGLYKPIQFKGGVMASAASAASAALESVVVATGIGKRNKRIGVQSSRGTLPPPLPATLNLDETLLQNLENIHQLENQSDGKDLIFKHILESLNGDVFKNLRKYISEIDETVIFYEQGINSTTNQSGGMETDIGTDIGTDMEIETAKEVIQLSKSLSDGVDVELSTNSTADKSVIVEKRYAMKNTQLNCTTIHYYGTLLCAFVYKAAHKTKEAANFVLSSVLQANLQVAAKTVETVLNNELTCKEYDIIKVCVDTLNYKAIETISEKKNKDGSLKELLDSLITNIKQKEQYQIQLSTAEIKQKSNSIAISMDANSKEITKVENNIKEINTNIKELFSIPVNELLVEMMETEGVVETEGGMGVIEATGNETSSDDDAAAPGNDSDDDAAAPGNDSDDDTSEDDEDKEEDDEDMYEGISLIQLIFEFSESKYKGTKVAAVKELNVAKGLLLNLETDKTKYEESGIDEIDKFESDLAVLTYAQVKFNELSAELEVNKKLKSELNIKQKEFTKDNVENQSTENQSTENQSTENQSTENQSTETRRRSSRRGGSNTTDTDDDTLDPVLIRDALAKIEIVIVEIVSNLYHFIKAKLGSFTFDFYFILKILATMYMITHIATDINIVKRGLTNNAAAPPTFTDIGTLETVLSNPSNYMDPIVISTSSMIKMAIHNHNDHFNMKKFDEFSPEQFEPISADNIRNYFQGHNHKTMQLLSSDVKDIDGIFTLYNDVQSHVQSHNTLNKYNTTGMSELLRFREHAISIMDVNEVPVQAVIDKYTNALPPMNQCMLNNMDLVMKHFDAHVRAIFGDGIDTYGFLFEYFARAENDNFISNVFKATITDLSAYIGKETSDLVTSSFAKYAMGSGFVDDGIRSRIGLINAREQSLTKTPVSKGLFGIFKQKKITFIDDILSSVVAGDNDIAANYLALNILVNVVPNISKNLPGLEHISINAAKLSVHCVSTTTLATVRNQMIERFMEKLPK
jgi:hypothetical protein